MKHTKKCPECGGTEIYTTAIVANEFTKFLPGVGGFFRNEQPKMDAYVCAKCGCYQLFVGRRWLSEIPEKFERHG